MKCLTKCLETFPSVLVTSKVTITSQSPVKSVKNIFTSVFRQKLKTCFLTQSTVKTKRFARFIQRLICGRNVSIVPLPYLLQTCMRLFSLLPTLGGAGSSGNKHAESWRCYMQRLLNSSHATLNELLEICDFDDVVNVEGDTVKGWDEVKGHSKYKVLAQRVDMLLFGIRQMFT